MLEYLFLSSFQKVSKKNEKQLYVPIEFYLGWLKYEKKYCNFTGNLFLKRTRQNKSYIQGLGCHHWGTRTSPWLGVITAQKFQNKKKLTLSFIPQLLIHSLVLHDRYQQIELQHFDRLTQTPPTGPYCTNGAPHKRLSPFLQRVDSVSRSTLFQSYYPISHPPARTPIHTHPLCVLYSSFLYSICPSRRRPPSPPFSPHLRHIHHFSQSLTFHLLNMLEPLQHLSVYSFIQ